MEAPAEDPKAWRGLAVRANRKPLNITSLRRARQPNSLAPPLTGCLDARCRGAHSVAPTRSDRRPFKLSKALCAVAHCEMPYIPPPPPQPPPPPAPDRADGGMGGRCLAVGGLKSSSGSFLVQAAQALPRPTAERPTKQFACRLRSDDKPISLSWRDECGPPLCRLPPFRST